VVHPPCELGLGREELAERREVPRDRARLADAAYRPVRRHPSHGLLALPLLHRERVDEAAAVDGGGVLAVERHGGRAIEDEEELVAHLALHRERRAVRQRHALARRDQALELAAGELVEGLCAGP